MICLQRNFWPDTSKAAIVAPNQTSSNRKAPTLALITPETKVIKSGGD